MSHADTDWQDHAECAKPGFDAAVMFSEGRVAREARAACARCPVSTLCRAWTDHLEGDAWSRNTIAGFVAGETTSERIARRKRERRARRERVLADA